MFDLSLFSEHLRSLLKEHHLSQVQLAASLGISKYSLNNYVNGQRLPEASILFAIAQYFHTSIDWLLTGKECCSGAKSEYTDDEAEFLHMYRELNAEGKTIVKASCYQEYRRITLPFSAGSSDLPKTTLEK